MWASVSKFERVKVCISTEYEYMRRTLLPLRVQVWNFPSTSRLNSESMWVWVQVELKSVRREWDFSFPDHPIVGWGIAKTILYRRQFRDKPNYPNRRSSRFRPSEANSNKTVRRISLLGESSFHPFGRKIGTGNRRISSFTHNSTGSLCTLSVANEFQRPLAKFVGLM